MPEKLVHFIDRFQKQRGGSAPDLSIHMPTYIDGKQLSELTERRAGQTKPLFDLRAEAAEKERAEK